MSQLSIFVSHSHQDNDFCTALVRGLRQAEADVWYDEHNLGAGHLLNDIQRELLARPVFIVILSKAAFASTWVSQECQWAYQLYMREPNRVLLPVTASPIEARDFNTWLFLESFKRIEASGYRPLPADEAIAATLKALVLPSTKVGTQQAPRRTPAYAPNRQTPLAVLWVDDRPSNNFFARRTMEGWGIQFTISTSTDDALGKLIQHRFDAIISDMGRPPDSRAGYTLLEAIRQQGISIPYIIYASSDRPEHTAEAMSRGAFGSTGTLDLLFQLVARAVGIPVNSEEFPR
jgi:CheY-like chemotaxis protein